MLSNFSDAISHTFFIQSQYGFWKFFESYGQCHFHDLERFGKEMIFIMVWKSFGFLFGKIAKHILKCFLVSTMHGVFVCFTSGVSGQAVQPVPLTSLKLRMAVYGQKLDGRPSG